MKIKPGFLHYLLLVTLAGLPCAALPAEQPLDRIIATVNDSVITQSELDNATASIRNSLHGSGAPLPPASTLRHQVLQQLIDTRLQLQAAKEAGITVTPAEIDRGIAMIAQQNNVSLATLYSTIERQGMTREAYRKEIHDEILVQKTEQQAIAATVTLTAEEAKADEETKKKIWFSKFNKALKQWLSLLRNQATINQHILA